MPDVKREDFVGRRELSFFGCVDEWKAKLFKVLPFARSGLSWTQNTNRLKTVIRKKERNKAKSVSFVFKKIFGTKRFLTKIKNTRVSSIHGDTPHRFFVLFTHKYFIYTNNGFCLSQIDFVAREREMKDLKPYLVSQPQPFVWSSKFPSRHSKSEQSKICERHFILLPK